jgi:hypothetical protein
MTTSNGHFDGKVVVRDEPFKLDAGTKVLVVPKQSARSVPRGTPTSRFLQAIANVQMSSEDVALIEKAIIEGRKQIDPPEDHA